MVISDIVAVIFFIRGIRLGRFGLIGLFLARGTILIRDGMFLGLSDMGVNCLLFLYPLHYTGIMIKL